MFLMKSCSCVKLVVIPSNSGSSFATFQKHCASTSRKGASGTNIFKARRSFILNLRRHPISTGCPQIQSSDIAIQGRAFTDALSKIGCTVLAHRWNSSQEDKIAFFSSSTVAWDSGEQKYFYSKLKFRPRPGTTPCSIVQ